MPQYTFKDILSQVHLEMELQKIRSRCFSGITLLHKIYSKTPQRMMQKIIKSTYRLLPVSYTNIGRIDHERLFFKNCIIDNCYVTGSYRLPPDFQLTISTFQNTCTLNCTLIGDSADDSMGQYILDEVKKELLQWINA